MVTVFANVLVWNRLPFQHHMIKAKLIFFWFTVLSCSRKESE